jgi:OmpA-like transmembrane domain
MQIRTLTLMCCGLLFGAQAKAGILDLDEPNVLLGFGVGRLGLDAESGSEHSTGWTITTGYKFNQYITAEVSWLGGGDPLISTKRITGGTQVDTINDHFWTVTGIGSWPFTETYSAFGRVGMLSSSGNSLVTRGATSTRSELSGTEVIYGAGVAMTVDNGSLRLEYLRSSLADEVASYISLSAVWKITF